MADVCKVHFYNSANDKNGLEQMLTASLDQGNVKAFVDYVTQYNPSRVRVSLKPLVTDTDAQLLDSVRELYTDLNSIIYEWHDNNKGTELNMDEVRNEIWSALSITDANQTHSVADDTETKTTFEAAENNTKSLNRSLIDIYSSYSMDQIDSVKESFGDELTALMYFDVSSGILVKQDNHLLNKNIRDHKQWLFGTVVSYLKSEYAGDPEIDSLPDSMYTSTGKVSANYKHVMNLFQNKVLGDESFMSDLQSQHADEILKTRKQAAEAQYMATFKVLKDNRLFMLNMHEKFTGAKGTQMDKVLYDAYHPSEYYVEMKRYVLKNATNLTVEQMASFNTLRGLVEGSDISLLSATNAFAKLANFDSLLNEMFGGQISIAPNTSGHEVDTALKYTYSKDTKHQRNSFQSSEKSGSENYTSKFIKTVLNMIPLLNYATGQYMSRRINPQMTLASIGKLREMLISGALKFSAYANRDTDRQADIEELTTLARTFIENPVRNLQRMLEILFTTPPRSRKSLAQFISDPGMIFTDDLNVLRSIYEVVFNKNSTKSIYSQVMDSDDIANTTNLLEGIAGYGLRNNPANYITTSESISSGEVAVTEKPKYYNNVEVNRIHKQTNLHIAQMSPDARAELADTYQFTEGGKDNLGNVTYTVTLSDTSRGDMQLTLGVPESLQGQLMVTSKDFPMAFDQDTQKFLQTLGDPDNDNGVNLISLRYKMSIPNQNSATIELSAAEQDMVKVLKFLDDTLGLGILTDPQTGLQVLESYRTRYVETENMKGWLEPLVKLGMRAAYVNSQYIKAGDENLRTYLIRMQDSVYLYHLDNLQTSKLFTSRYNMDYVIASYSDPVLNIWADAKAEQRGDINPATVKNKQGDAISNYSVAKMGSNVDHYLNKQSKTPNSSVQSLMFVKHPTMIKRVYHDLEATSMYGESKSIQDFSLAELAHHSIFHRFYGRYLGDINEGHRISRGGRVLVQPTAYADKTTFMMYDVGTKYVQSDGTVVDLMKADVPTLIKAYIETLGDASTKVRDTSRGKMDIIARDLEQSVKDNEENGFAQDDVLTTEQILHHVTEQELIDAADALGYTVELDHDYRLVKDGKGRTVIGLNGLLDYNAETFNSEERLSQRLQIEQRLFIQQLLNASCSFQVLVGTDTLDMYTSKQKSDKAKSRTPILSVIEAWFEATGTAEQRAEFFKNWVDERTGKLILAKQNGKNILSISDGFDIDAEVELNPMLAQYFYVEGLLSNNLRYSMSGVETNHAIGKNSPLLSKLGADTVTDWNQENKNNTLNGEQFEEVKNLRNGILDLNDLYKVITDPNTDVTPETRAALYKLYEEVATYEANTAQGTQYKRNVIIPATLQYCMQNTREGIASKIRCAVIRDEEAPVFNYTGSHEKGIKPCDGSAYITSFESIMENRCLQDQAVGYNKKPIWHHYNSENGTAFLAKFATYTLTNAFMRSSMLSTVNGYNLFRKATDIRWNGSIDLTQNMLATRSFGGSPDNSMEQSEFRKWVRSTLFGGKQLYYKDQYGNQIQIVGFDKTVLSDGRVVYYTLERPQFKQKAEKVYHIFHDVALENEEGVETQHMRVSEDQLASVLASGLENVHTIDSLFELHSALGGLECVDADGVYSEYNNEVVVNFMCNVGSPKADYSRTGRPYIDQTTYNQPLKDQQIGYLFNHTAVKNGAQNINQSSAWRDRSALHWFYVDSDGLGMQMNADHDVINSELTEFSQVIAATAAYGYSFDQNSEILQSLARAGFQASKQLSKAVDKFLDSLTEDAEKQSLARSDLYEAVGRMIIANDRIRDVESLTNIIMQGVSDIFRKYSDHTNDLIKTPFSDDNIYGEFIATLGSMITSESIKRKHPGSGNVMCPGYNMMQYFEVYTNRGEVRKMMVDDVLKRVMNVYKNDLWAFFKSRPEYNDQFKSIKIEGQKGIFLRSLSLQELEQLALQLDPTGSFSKYYTTITDIEAANRFRMQTWLNTMQEQAPTYNDKSWFMPTDIVDIIHPDGHIETITLDSMDDYYKFKDAEYPEGCTFRVNVTRPHNLRPSLIRWQYVDKDGTVRYMNYFDLQHVKDAYKNNTASGPAYRAKVQEALNLIHSGSFKNADGDIVKILEGTLENSEAELIQSNMYRDTFGTGNASLNDILSQGEKFFQNQQTYLRSPKNQMYDVAFMRDTGAHTLLTFSTVQESNLISQKRFKNTRTKTDNSIVLYDGTKEQFQVAQWVGDDTVTFDNDKQKFVWVDSETTAPLDQNKYRVNKDGSVLRRVDLVTRYTMTTKRDSADGKRKHDSTNTLYRIADKEVFTSVFGEEEGLNKMRSIVTGIYNSGDYKLAEINMIGQDIMAKKDTLRSALKGITTYTEFNKQKFALSQLDVLDKTVKDGAINFSKEDIDALERAKIDLLNEKAHEKWISFCDSQKFIASRIPAQTLQSFMAMKCIGWTSDTSNVSYVSHFQTYLQGSDYDIDKAYVMGQSYDSNATYIKWSSYFDYSTVNTLAASKTLPSPKGIEIVMSGESGADISAEARTLLELAEHDTYSGILRMADDADESSRVQFLNTLARALRKVEGTNGVVLGPYDSISDDDLTYVLNTLQTHENTVISDNIAEKAYKNVASANIYAVSHDIRNRDQAYTPIAMDIMREAAEYSPKGRLVDSLNSFNPMAKYVMQRQNLVGKAVIGIAANGEKFYFNTYYYWTDTLRHPNLTDADVRYLRFQTTLLRIKGRAEGTRFDPKMQENTVNHIPDLNRYDDAIRDNLQKLFGVNDENYVYVDQKISQLLSAATDNAKELILDKINASVEFAKMYVYLMIMGYDVNDVAAFMTSPTAEMISRRVASNIFEKTGNTPYWAIQTAMGKVKCADYLHGSYFYEDDYTGETSSETKIQKTIGTLKGIIDKIPEIQEYILKADAAKQEELHIEPVEDTPEAETETANEAARGRKRTWRGVLVGKSLDDIMQLVIRGCAENNINLLQYTKGIRDFETISYFRHCQDTIAELRYTALQHGEDGFAFVQADAEEFLKIFNLASDMSNVTTSFLKLNQGLPTDEMGIIQLLLNMKRVFIGAERSFGIRDTDLFETKKDMELSPEARAKKQLKRNKNMANLIKLIKKNNPYITDDEDIKRILREAHKKEMIGGFDPYKMFTDPSYKQTAKDPSYKQTAKEYLDLIKGTVNIIDMIDHIPHYAQIMKNCRDFLVANQELSLKSRLVYTLLNQQESPSKKDLERTIVFANKLMALDFLVKCDTLVLNDMSVAGFDHNFDWTKTHSFDFSTLEGISSFKHFVETEFLAWLRKNHKDNPLVAHLTLTEDDGHPILATDIDLMHPYQTEVTRKNYGDILRGMALFEGVEFVAGVTQDDNTVVGRYTVADVFQLYNLIANNNRYGADRLTTAFKGCSDKNSILQKYLNDVASSDYTKDYIPEWAWIDYQICLAPLVNRTSEKFHKEMFIKVRDPMRGYIIKQYNKSSDSYSEYQILPPLGTGIAEKVSIEQRIANFTDSCPFEMPGWTQSLTITNSIKFEGEATPEIMQAIQDTLVNLYVSSKALIYKDC